MYNTARFRYVNSVVKQGSMNLAFASQRMAIPKAMFMGLSSAASELYELSRNVGIKLNEKDIARAESSSTISDCRNRPGRRISSGCSRADSHANWMPLPTKTSSTSRRNNFHGNLKEKDWLD